MNKRCYRTIFNAIRGIMMAVAEFVKAHAGDTRLNGDVKTTTQAQQLSGDIFPALRPLAFSLLLALGQVVIVMPHAINVSQVQAEIYADPSASKSQQPIVLKAANGVEVVNIQTPNAAGVSRNTYKQFDVPKQGAIINNSRSNVQTQLGGWVSGNPMINTPARVIFNEVNSANPSYLNGFIEIAGSRADFVLANPNGISCSGCGFINANRATLTTGTPVFNGGDLAGYRVHGGDINIIGNGLDASNTNYTDIIARAVNVNAGIWANNLNVTTGTNIVNASNTQIAAITPDSHSPVSGYALDVGALGGMYAKKIVMIGTEAGLGVRNAGVMYAQTGSLKLDINGNLSNSNTIAGSTYAQIKANDITNTSANITSTEQMEIIARSLSGDGKVLAGGNAMVSLVDDYIHQASAELQANGNLTFTTAGQLTNQGQLLSGQTLTLNAKYIGNTESGEISGLHTHLNAEDHITNRGVIDGGDTFVSANVLNNIGTGAIYGDHIAIAASALNNVDETINLTTASAVIAARERLDIGASNILNQYDSQIFSAGDMYIQGGLNEVFEATGTALSLINNGGIIEALGSMRIEATDIQNLNSNITTQEVLITTEKIDRFTPRGKSVVLDSSDYPSARIGDVRISTRTAGPYSFREYHRYLATADTHETQILTTNPGQILAGNSMTIVGDLLNHDSEVIAGGGLNVGSATLENKNSQGELVKKYTNTGGEGTYYYDYDGSGSGFRYRVSYQGAYLPADEITTFNLATSRVTEYASFTSTGTNVAALSPATLSDTRLYQTKTDVTANYLVETDPRFSNYRTWLSSDYMLNSLSYDPATITKRLGDGFYEQKLVREQVAKLTGRRFLTGYANDEQQYQALMANGTTFAQSHQLIPGVALSEAQIAQLTSDIVWLVEQTITLPNGITTQALVPQVYVKLQAGDMSSHGSLLAGETIHLNIDSNLENSGIIAGRSIVSINADIINNLKGRINSNITKLEATQDIHNVGGTIEAQQALMLQAGRDINIATTTQSSQNTAGASSFTRANLDRVAGLYVSDPNGILVAVANNNINLNAANIINSGENGTTVIDAGNNLSLSTLTIAEQNNTIKNSKNYIKYGNTKEIGTSIQTQGDITLKAGRDLSARAASVTSEQSVLNAVAGNNLSVESGEATSNLSAAITTKRSGTFSSKKTERRDTFNDTEVIASTFSGEIVNLDSKNDISIKGSNVVGANGVNLNAGNNISIESAQATHQESHFNKTKKSGFSSSGASVSYGKSELATTNETQTVTNVGSTVGSVEGDVNINAGKQYKQTGSDILTPSGDINISAQQVDINAATDSYISQQTMKFKQSGITVGVSNPVINATQTVNQMKQAASQTSNGRMQALAAGTAALAVKNAADTVIAGNTQPKLDEHGLEVLDASGNNSTENPIDQVGGISLNISIGSSKAKSSSQQTVHTAKGSTLNAGGDINITAQNNILSPLEGERQSEGAGNINVIGSTLKAADDITLNAQHNINLAAAQNTSQQSRKNKSSSASLGVSVNLGLAGGVGVTAGLTSGKGNTIGNGTTWTETQIQSGHQQGDTVTLNSGKDTNLIGAQVSGNQIQANVGTSGTGNLNIQSLQDSDHYKGKQSNTGISITAPLTGTGWGGSLSSGNSKINSNYQSVNQQAGIFAGDGGFQINTHGNTDLKGAVIASTDKAIQDNKNSFTTQTLTTSNIENSAEYEAKGTSATVGYGTQGGLPQLSGAGIGQDEGKADSTTVSAVSAGEFNITDNTAQQIKTGKDVQLTVATLDHDVHVNEKGEAVNSQGESTANTINPIFDAEKVQREIAAQVKITQAFSQEAPRALNTFVQDKLKPYQEAQKTVRETEALLAKANQSDDSQSDYKAELQDKINQAYAVMAETQDDYDKWKENGDYRIASNIIIAAISGGASGATTAVTKESLSWAADVMRQAMIKDSKKFPGVIGTDGKVWSNYSGESVGVNGDNTKVAGGRIVLADLCANGRCVEDKSTVSGYAEDENGRVKLTISTESLKELPEYKDWRSPLGGHQGEQGQMATPGIQFDYAAGSFWDKLAEAYSGTHDSLNSVIWYDELGNGKNLDGTLIGKIGDITNLTNVVLATPFAASVLLPPEVWNAVFSAIKAN